MKIGRLAPSAAPGALLALALAVCALYPALERHRGRAALPAVVRGEGPLLASWQSVGGCGAGASSATGAGVKWIGRNVSGGLFHVEAQGNYVKTDYGYNYVESTLVTRDLSEKWNLGVNVPYLYKYMRNYFGLGFDVANQGFGDVNAMLTRRLGSINDYLLTLSVGLPTGSHDAHLIRATSEILAQDRQLGAGKMSGSLMLDHVIDHLWGVTVLGGVASWRGGENDLHNYRAPSGTAYAYSSYLAGRFAPGVGFSLTGFTGHDRDAAHGDPAHNGDQTSALFMAAANLSL